MRFDSIQSRLVVISFLFIVGTSLAMAAVAVNLTKRYLEIKTEEHFGLLAAYLARNAELGVLLDDRKMLERLAKNILKEEDVNSVKILTGSGEVLVNLHDALNNENLRVEIPIIAAQMDDEDLVLNNITRKKEIGKVVLGYSQKGLRSLVKKMTIRFFLISLFLSLVPFALFWLIAKSLVSPLKDLASVAKTVSEGNMGVRAVGGRFRETQLLASTFNTMLENLKKHQEKLAEVQKEMVRQHALAEVGKFSMMVAHEVKNPLSIIKGSVEILKKDNLDTDSLNTLWDFLEEEISRIDRVIEDFLFFARPKEPERNVVEMNSAVHNIVQKACFMNMDEETELLLEIESGACDILCDLDLMERAILNILRNAMDVCKKDDKIRIKTWSDRRYWFLSIEDSGPGIPREHRARVFEPFYTTKSKGTGLGLAMTKRIVELHGGAIFVGRSPLGGACFVIKLGRN